MDDVLAKPTPIPSIVSTTRVPNVFPTVDVPYKLAIIGEAPGADEEAHGIPFVGASGYLLDTEILGPAGILRQGCFVGNICKYRPPDNKIENFGLDHEKVLEGWAELKQELETYDPNCILSLGNTPLKFFTGRTGITNWRGSILSTLYGKVVPAIHPASVLREYKQWVLLRFDARRAREESNTKELSLPQRILETELTPDEICNRLNTWPENSVPLAFDIEGGLGGWTCCSVASASNYGFIIAWSKYSDTDQGRIAQALSRALYNSNIPKVLQTSLYDRFVLSYGFNMLIRNVRDDTMLKHWEIYPEASTKDDETTSKKKQGLGKGLGVIASIWTREPYYKYERKVEDPKTFYEYCIKDSCVTLEASLAMSAHLSGRSLRHYNFNMELLSPFLYMELRGFRYDHEGAATELGRVRLAMSECASRITASAGRDLTGAKGSISATRLKQCLYHEKGYPEQKSGRGPTAKVTTDVTALLNLHRKFPHDTFLKDVLLHRKLESLVETLSITHDPDGRIRCGYNPVGTETGRITCYTSPTGSGANLQTTTKKLRRLELADEDHWLFQCDLSGADGWTVAAHCIRHGDPTMYDDYIYGLKPARLIALFHEHPEYITAPRDELKEASAHYVDDNGWLYFTCKRIFHATNYGVKEKTLSTQVMVDSYKMSGTPIYVEPRICAALQQLQFIRYPGVLKWQQWGAREVLEGRNLVSASGHTRTFYGRRKSWNWKTRSHEADHETWKEFLADEPQENTTYVTNLALYRLWTDLENRNEDSSLKVEPLHQVHDALIGQFPKSLTTWALPKIREWFNNKIQVAGMELVIPFEGAYGRSWGELNEGTI